MPAFAGGVLYLLSAIIISATLNGAPDGRPARRVSRRRCRGVANPAVSPRAPEVKYLSHHAFALIAGSVLAAIAIAR